MLSTAYRHCWVDQEKKEEVRLTVHHEPRQWRLSWILLKHRNGFKAARHKGSINTTTA